MLKILKLAVIATVLACVTHPVLAQTPAAERYAAAIGVLTERFGPPEAFRDPPLKSDPVIAKSLSDIRTSMEVYGTDAFPVEGVNTAKTVCGPLSVMPIRYMLSGVNRVPGGPESFPTSAETSKLMTQPAIAQHMARKAVEYQDEMAMFVAVGVKCMSLYMPTLVTAWEHLPEIEHTPRLADSIRRIRGGTEKMIRGAVKTAVNPAISAENRQYVLTAIVTYIGNLAQTMPVTERKRLLEEAITGTPGFQTAYPKEYAAISLVLSDTTCTGICLVP